MYSLCQMRPGMLRPHDNIHLLIIDNALLKCQYQTSRKLESESCHATLVFLYGRCAVFLRVFSSAKQHAVVSSCFFVLADAARL